ncbi:MAG: hypothetical protein HYV36_04985, partial [Lentisphaerae bacterium]|nr:hypothetical protein [Lentisphaerota bacterium]
MITFKQAAAAGLPTIVRRSRTAAGLPTIALAAVGGLCLSMFAAAPASGAPLSTNAAWTWEAGANITNQNGTYGTQGQPAPTNTPGGRYGAVSWTDGLGALWLFGGLGYPASGGSGYLNDLWKYDPATTNWTWE